MNKEQLVQDLIRDEGLRTEIYYCTEGVPTIGVGRNLERGISKAEAMYLLTNDIADTEQELDRRVPCFHALPDDAKRALMNLAFNIGVPRLLGFKKMLAALEGRDFANAAAEALDSKWARQVGERSNRIAELIRNA